MLKLNQTSVNAKSKSIECRKCWKYRNWINWELKESSKNQTNLLSLMPKLNQLSVENNKIKTIESRKCQNWINPYSKGQKWFNRARKERCQKCQKWINQASKNSRIEPIQICIFNTCLIHFWHLSNLNWFYFGVFDTQLP